MQRNLIAENWRLERSRYSVVGNHCQNCNCYYFPEKEMCLGCGNTSLSEHIYNGQGTLIEWTKIYDVATGFEIYAPLYYGIIELKEGVKISAQLTGIEDEEKLVPGIKTKMVFRKLFDNGKQGVVTYGFKAQPVFD